jgi:diguanylate cyclase (GGDEF)-like protein
VESNSSTLTVAADDMMQSDALIQPGGDRSEAARLRAVYSYAVLDTAPEPNFDRITNLAASIFNVPIATLCLADADRHFFKSRYGVDATEMPRRLSFCDETLRTQSGFIVPDAFGDSRFRMAPIVAGPPGVRFYAGSRLVNANGIPIGSLCVLDTKPRSDFSARSSEILTNLAGTVVELLEARSRQIELAACTEELAHLAGHDSLTGLPNRRTLQAQIEHVMAHVRNDEQVAVLYIDLDHFKRVNDTLGHAVGDALLREVASQLRANIRETDLIARLGGDEFAVMLSGPQVKQRAAELASRLIRTISAPYSLRGHEVHIGASIGIALGENTSKGWPLIEDMFSEADTALYQAKSGGRGSSCFVECRRATPSPRADLPLAGNCVGMPAPTFPSNEPSRLAALRRFELLDTSPEPVFDQITRMAAKLLNVPIALISLIDENRQWFKSRVGLDVHETSRELAFCAHAILDEDVLVVPNALDDPRFKTNPLVTGDPHIRFYAGAPLRTKEGLALGTICVIDQKARPPLSTDERRTLQDLSAMAMAHIEARRAVGYLQVVTGLSNRFRFIEDIDAFVGDPERGTTQIAVVVIDTASPQQCAEVARTLGHVYGDAFEVASAQTIRENLPNHVKLYHLSTARFGCVLPLISESSLADVLNGLAAALRESTLCLEIPVTTSNGIGLSVYPTDGSEGTELLRAATSAAHEALAARKAWCTYSPTQNHASQRSLRLLKDLTTGIAMEGQLHLVYQPKMDLRSGRCVGAEALVRWEHPDLGSISPSEFIPLSEQTALVRRLTDWVFAAALNDVARWRTNGWRERISINISMKDLSDENFAPRIAKTLDHHGVQPDWIEIEVTETALMTDRPQVNRQLNELRRIGIDIAIDDFGTGQSALSYLKQIPADIVKIDQLFIRELGSDQKDQSLVRSTIKLAHELGYRVVAEGIETTDVYNWLRDQGCDIGQGYLISRPLNAPEFEHWLRRFGEGRILPVRPCSLPRA